MSNVSTLSSNTYSRSEELGQIGGKLQTTSIVLIGGDGYSFSGYMCQGQVLVTYEVEMRE
jgi:hypothetical protein